MVRKMREKIQVKLNSMASILVDDIVNPNKKEQEGSESIVASFFDKDGNKFLFDLKLTVVPEQKEGEIPDPIGMSQQEQMDLILREIAEIKEEIAEIKQNQNNGQDTPQTAPDENESNGSDTNENSGNEDEGS